jgi:hypothetical protein
MSIVFLFDENPNVASAGLGGAALGSTCHCDGFTRRRSYLPIHLVNGLIIDGSSCFGLIHFHPFEILVVEHYACL